MNENEGLEQPLKESTAPRVGVERLVSCIDTAKCPKCGYGVVLGIQNSEYKTTPDDPLVYCTDMGHWGGRLSECVQ